MTTHGYELLESPCRKVLLPGTSEISIKQLEEQHEEVDVRLLGNGIRANLRAEDFKMDESQFSAMQYALTSELAVIQGPPGTGKTFIGLQLVKLLFWSTTSCPNGSVLHGNEQG